MRRLPAWRLLLSQLTSPLVLLLVAAAAISLLVSEWTDAAVVAVIVAASSGIGFWREHDAGRALDQLLSRVVLKVRVLRDGSPREISAPEVVPGDIVLLSAGCLMPGDGVLLEATDFYVNQAVLTGETFPVRKTAAPVAAAAPLSDRSNAVYLGTNAKSGSARCLVVSTGAATMYGQIARRLTLRPPETEFDRGIRQFGTLLTSVMMLMTLAVFAINVNLHRPVVESLLFSVALAVGLTPELLPAILSINLARSAQVMAKSGVLVRRLNAIENLGSMDVLCTDKTGTLTEGDVRLQGAFDDTGAASVEVGRKATLNAFFQTGLANPLDEALLRAGNPDTAGIEKRGEIPYDFVRKRLSVVIRDVAGPWLLTKGAFENVLAVCTRTHTGAPLDDPARASLRSKFLGWGQEGFRVLGVAEKRLAEQDLYGRDDERDLVFAGFLTFFDPPKRDVAKTIIDLRALGVSLKMITGDARAVAEHVAEAVGLQDATVLTGADLNELRDEALWHAAERTDLFVQVDPNQKERIILALKKTGHVVGYLGDGINDAPALHAADVGISVEGAVDVAKEAADLVLLERDLDVLRRGLLAGRMTFANTMKYVLTTTSANLGNMVSMALASLFLPFLPLTAGQILLNNFLSDVPAMALASDSVDQQLIDRPRRWDMRLLKRFMFQFGLLSSLFDFLTFAALLRVFHADYARFRTAWFLESLLTELVIALVVRTRQPFYRSAPSRGLWISTAAIAALAFALPYLPLANFLGFEPLPAPLLAVLVAITATYVVSAEALKRLFYRKGD